VTGADVIIWWGDGTACTLRQRNMRPSILSTVVGLASLLSLFSCGCEGWVARASSSRAAFQQQLPNSRVSGRIPPANIVGNYVSEPSRPSRSHEFSSLHSTASVEDQTAPASADGGDSDRVEDEESIFYTIPEEAVVRIKPKAMKRLMELRGQQKKLEEDFLVLRMGVKSGGCSGLSYVMDFMENTDGNTIAEDDVVDEYTEQRIRCVVDSKSMLYLYGLELDYSDKLIGGGFKFFNPNAEESCGCGSSFGV
jgi:iron-sulfur cluster assembly accessory protein